MLDHFHHILVDQEWMRWKGYKVDWKNPRDINEKIQWLLCFSDTSKWSVFSDKIKVREYVESKGAGDLLIPLLGVWDCAEDIDFGSLPDRFVIKCNHDSGSSHIVDKAAGFNEDAIRSDLASHLKVKYGYVHGEMYYNDIKPRVLAEKLLEGDKDISGSTVDYKVWCFDGKPYSVLTCSDRKEDSLDLNIYDLEWNVHPEALSITGHYKDGGGKIPKPACLDEILYAASKLSEGFPEVRVDFYQSGGKAYFGEMTFSSLCGKMDYFTDKYLVELGRQCVLPDMREV